MPRQNASGTLVVGAGVQPRAERAGDNSSTLLHSMVGGYRIEREIGRGGMGSVYLAEHPLLKTSAAVKVLHHEFSGRSDLAERFIAEARAVAALRHPHIVRIYDLVTLPDERLAIVMEYLNGQTLEQLAGSTPMNPARVRSILLQLCSALGMAHHYGVVHRDLKAQNIVVMSGNSADYVKLLDFGLVKNESQDDGLTTPGMVIGTPQYMAPEQITGESIDRRTDIYALGVLAYRLLRGSVPFDGAPTQVMFKHVHAALPELAGIHPAFRSVIVRALAKRKEERFADMTAMARALRECPMDSSQSQSAKPAPFTARVEGTTIHLRFVSLEAFQQFEQYELSKGRVFVPGPPPTLPGLLRVVIDVPNCALREAPATLLGIYDRAAAERHGIPEGFAVTLRGQLAPYSVMKTTTVPPALRQPRPKRLAFHLPVTIRTAAEMSLSGQTTNLSSNGLGVTTSKAIPVGSPLSVALSLPTSESAQLKATVVWSREFQGPQGRQRTLGLRLTRVDERYLHFLANSTSNNLFEAPPGMPLPEDGVDVDLSGGIEEDSVPTDKVRVRSK